MADINNNDIWIDVETLAKLRNITRRAVRLALNQNKYEYKVENIRGGKTYKIKLSTLEEELQLKYFRNIMMIIRLAKMRLLNYQISTSNKKN